MLISATILPSAASVLGAQRPRHLWVPDYVKSYGQEAVELAIMAGLNPDDWQRFVIECLLGVRPDGSWAAFEAGLEVPRQNGKGGVYEIRELAGLFLLGEKQLIHSAHEYKTAEQALDRMEALIGGCDELSREVRTVKRSHGQEGIYLKSGQVLRYFTRTASGGRGFSCDFLGLDEAMKIKHSMHAAMFPTMSARPNPQILYAGSAVDQETMDDGIVFANIRERGIEGGDPRLAYFGWSAAFEHPDDVTEDDAKNPENWAAANPALGIRVTAEYVEMEQRALSARGFAVERLGVGDWPRLDVVDAQGISQEAWAGVLDADSALIGSACFAFDVRPDRSSAAIAAAGFRADGLYHVELAKSGGGTGWVVDWLVERVKKHAPVAVICDAGGPAAALLTKVTQAGVTVTTVNGREYAQACGQFYDAVEQKTVRHRDDPALAAAVTRAATRPLGDAWAWSRKGSEVDISPLVACTLALRGSIDAGASSGGGFEW